jgi:regulator of sigma E protease
MLDLVTKIFLGIIIVLLVGFTVFIHELGHYLSARIFGLVIDSFSIGFGPAIWKKKYRNVVYKIGMIPFGGYVALPQLDPSGMSLVQGSAENISSESRRQENFCINNEVPQNTFLRRFRQWKLIKQKSHERHSMDNSAGEVTAVNRQLPDVPVWKRIVVLLSGVLGNMIFAFGLACIISISYHPDDSSERSTVIGYISTNNPAYIAGLRIGDEFLKVNGETVTSWYEVQRELHLASGGATNIIVEIRSPDGRINTLNIPMPPDKDSRYILEGLDKAMPCVVGYVIEGGSAQKAGVRPLDVIKEIDNIKVYSIRHLIEIVSERADKTVPLLVERKGKPLLLSVTPRYHPGEKRALIGVGFTGGGLFGSGTPWMKYRNPLAQIQGDIEEMARVLRAFISRRQGEAKQAFEALTGPVGIFVLLWHSVLSGILIALGFVRFVNVNLAIINILPLPVLDGGHILFCLWEGITRRKANAKLVNILVQAFAIFLIGMLLFVTFRDITRIFYPGYKARQHSEAKIEQKQPSSATELQK